MQLNFCGICQKKEESCNMALNLFLWDMPDDVAENVATPEINFFSR